MSEDSSPISKKRPGRKPIPDELKRNIRYVRCVKCDHLNEYDYKVKQRGPVVDPTLTPRAKQREYNKRYREKLAMKKND